MGQSTTNITLVLDKIVLSFSVLVLSILICVFIVSYNNNDVPYSFL